MNRRKANLRKQQEIRLSKKLPGQSAASRGPDMARGTLLHRPSLGCLIMRKRHWMMSNKVADFVETVTEQCTLSNQIF
jgi:hypothetical protein